MKSIHLNFDGYWDIDHLHLLPRSTGIACLYRGRVSSSSEHVTPVELLWMGEVLSARESLAEMTALRQIQDSLKEEEILCVSFAPIVRGRKEAAEALAEQSRPRFRRKKLWNPFPLAQVSLSGAIALLQVPPFRKELWMAREASVVTA